VFSWSVTVSEDGGGAASPFNGDRLVGPYSNPGRSNSLRHILQGLPRPPLQTPTFFAWLFSFLPFFLSPLYFTRGRRKSPLFFLSRRHNSRLARPYLTFRKALKPLRHYLPRPSPSLLPPFILLTIPMPLKIPSLMHREPKAGPAPFSEPLSFVQEYYL
jgi:hypothetical protein